MIETKPKSYKLKDIIANMEDGEARTIIRYGIPTRIKKEGFMVYYECGVCGDLSRCKGPLGNWFCINQHKDEKGNEIQPASDGINMPGKPWSSTPEGKEKAKPRKIVKKEPKKKEISKKSLLKRIKDKIKK